MGFLPAVLVLAVAADPALRPRLASPRLWAALAIGLLGLVPNLVWNVTHDFVTFRHTGTNADWGSRVLDPGSIAEFAGAQFGVFGPVPLALLILAAAGRVGSGRRRADRFLLTTSVPILLVFVGQSALARANANWAATAYPAATVLVAGLFDSLPRLRAFRRATLWIAGAASAALITAPPLAPVLTLPGIGRPFERVLGWSDYAAAVAAAAKEAGARTIVVARRSDVAGLLYHLRDDGLEVAVLRPGGSPPRDHYQLTRPFRPDLPAPGLLVAPPGFPRPPDLTATGPAAALPVTRGVAKGLAMEATPVTW
jgi:4-amino-4-deoxy-L-arabinose transferase-like glycosyltransferase